MRYVLLLCTPGGEQEAFSARGRRTGGGSTRTVMTIALAPASTATTVRVRGGHVLLEDAPVVAAGDQLTGVVIAEGPTRDGAIAAAAETQEAAAGCVEIRTTRTTGLRDW